VDGRTGIISTVAGTGQGYAGDGGSALAAVFDAPKEFAIDREGNLLIVDTENHAIRQIDASTGTVATIAGSGRQGGEGDGGPAQTAALDRPHGAAVAADGSIYIGDTNNHRIRNSYDRGSPHPPSPDGPGPPSPALRERGRAQRGG